jgi:hypothetical protein
MAFRCRPVFLVSSLQFIFVSNVTAKKCQTELFLVLTSVRCAVSLTLPMTDECKRSIGLRTSSLTTSTKVCEGKNAPITTEILITATLCYGQGLLSVDSPTIVIQ